MIYDVLITHDRQSGWYVGEVPDLPGCFTQGQTVEEVVANAREAITLYLQDTEQPPSPSEHLLRPVKVDAA